jgi:hypothetical protein
LDLDQIRHVENFPNSGKALSRLSAHLNVMHHRVLPLPTRFAAAPLLIFSHKKRVPTYNVPPRTCPDAVHCFMPCAHKKAYFGACQEKIPKYIADFSCFVV